MGSMLSLSLEVAKNTLLNSGVAIETVSHNIANADNKTYARQKVLFSTNTSLEIRAGWLGTGAHVAGIIQQRDQLIEQRLLGSTSRESGYKTLESHFSSIETLMFDDGEQGISKALGEFWSAWERLSQNPGGLSEQTLVYEHSRNLTNAIQQSYGNVVDYASGVEVQMENTTEEVNSLLTRIADSNLEIRKYEIGGEPANDLRDIRYQDLKKLAELVPISWQEDDTGSLTISIDTVDAGGALTTVNLVEGRHAGYLKIANDADDNAQIIVGFKIDYENDPVFTENALADFSELGGGELPALKEIFDKFGVRATDFNTVLADPQNPDLSYLDRLNLFTYNLITEVNTAYGDATEFVFSEVAPVADFSADQIAIDAAFTVGQIDSSSALDIVDVQNNVLAGLGNASLNEYLADIQQRLGLDLQNSSSRSDFHEALRTQLEAQQQSVSGVSIDEEMVELLKYQQVYQAAAKIIERTAEMLRIVTEMV